MPTSLKVPYLSQIDNELNPHGSCNVTSIGMCLAFLGFRGDRSYPQFEDQLYQKCEDNHWDRHSPGDLKQLAESFDSVEDDLTTTGTLDDIRAAIDAGKPCVVHGYFTRSGHIVVIRGYDDQGFIANDPYGEWFSWGYDIRASGDGIHYSNELIASVCSPESVKSPKHIWLHRISRRKAL